MNQFLIISIGFLSLAHVINCSVPLSVYHRILEREGLRHVVSDKVLQRIADTVDLARDRAELEKTENEIFHDVRIQRRSGWDEFVRVMRIINQVVRWIGVFQKNLATMIDNFPLPFQALSNVYYKIRGSYQRSVRRYDGDYEKITSALKDSMIREASKYLSPADVLELQRRISELEKRESKMLTIVYDLTRKNPSPTNSSDSTASTSTTADVISSDHPATASSSITRISSSSASSSSASTTLTTTKTRNEGFGRSPVSSPVAPGKSFNRSHQKPTFKKFRAASSTSETKVIPQTLKVLHQTQKPLPQATKTSPQTPKTSLQTPKASVSTVKTSSQIPKILLRKSTTSHPSSKRN